MAGWSSSSPPPPPSSSSSPSSREAGDEPDAKLVALMTLKYSWAPVPRHEVAHLVDEYLGVGPLSLLPRKMVRVSRAMRDLVRPYMYAEFAIEYADVGAAVKRARRWV